MNQCEAGQYVCSRGGGEVAYQVRSRKKLQVVDTAASKLEAVRRCCGDVV